jgi:hypothetical protein
MTSLILFCDIKNGLLKCRKKTHKKEFDELFVLFKTNKIAYKLFIRKLRKYYDRLYFINNDNDIPFAIYEPSYILVKLFILKDVTIFCFDDEERNREEHNERLLNIYYQLFRIYL